MKSDVGYLRVSTDAQTEKYGLDVQRNEIMKFCEKRKVEINEWYVDGGYSGSKLDRPEIQRLLSDAENGTIRRVFVYKLDRMSRDVVDALTLLYRVLPAYGVDVVSVSEDLKFNTPMDKVMVGVSAIMGQYEREVIYARTRAGMMERVKKGLWPSGATVPYGYRYDRNDGILHIIPEQAENVRAAFSLYISGVSCDKIARKLGLSCEAHARNMIARRAYIGLIPYKGRCYDGLHEPIIDENVFLEAQKCLEKRKKKGFVVHQNILSGLCICGKCGAHMRYQKWGAYHKLVCYSTQKSGKPYMKKDPNCDNKPVRADYVEREVERCFREFAVRSVEEKKDDGAAKLQADLKKENAKIQNLYEVFAETPTDNLLTVIRAAEERAERMNREIEALARKRKSQQAGKYAIQQRQRINDITAHSVQFIDKHSPDCAVFSVA